MIVEQQYTPDPVPLRISPHPMAPLFMDVNNPTQLAPDSDTILAEVLTLMTSPTFNINQEDTRAIVRQAGFVSLWFFLKCIASFNGPYEKLTPHLHVDMCNFRQLMTETPNSKGAGFIGRSHFKSSVWTHGGNSWELLRNPNLSIGIASAVMDRSLEFLHYSQDTFKTNELFRYLYPEYCPKDRQVGWNDEIMTLPNKTRNLREPSIKPLTAGGSSQGIHVDLLSLDDIIGDSMLDSNRTAGADMFRMGNWLKSSIRTLVKDWKESRVYLSGTRYSFDDAYEAILNNVRNKYGYWDGMDEYEAKPTNEWDVYYRQIEEDGKIIFPEAFTREGLEKLRQEDPWTYYTQYVNNPKLSLNTSLADFNVRDCAVDYDRNFGWVISWRQNGKDYEEPLSYFDVVSVTDPAASDKQKSQSTSRSALLVLATHSSGARFFIDGCAGFEPITTVFDWMFERFKKWNARITGLEMQGPFKVLSYILTKEQTTRQEWISLVPVKAEGDKNTRIEATLRPLLNRNQIFAVPTVKALLEEELQVFPNGKKKDVLDTATIGIRAAFVPRPKEIIDNELDEEEESRYTVERNPFTGY